MTTGQRLIAQAREARSRHEAFALARKAANFYDMSHYNDGLGLTVTESEEPIQTGLLDANGHPLVRVRAPIGFDLKRGPK